MKARLRIFGMLHSLAMLPAAMWYLLVCGYAPAFAAELPAEQRRALEALTQDIVPAEGAARPPYQLARYDLGETSLLQKEDMAGPSLGALTELAEARQDRLEKSWRSLKGIAPGDLTAAELADWRLLAYAFDEMPLQEALHAATAAGPMAQYRLARLLMAECRFDPAVTLLASVADAPQPGKQDIVAGDLRRDALVLLVRHDVERRFLEEQVMLLPLQFDLSGYLQRRASEPAIGRLIEGLRHTTAIRLPEGLAHPGDLQQPKESPTEIDLTLSAEEIASEDGGFDSSLLNLPVNDLRRRYLTLSSQEFVLKCDVVKPGDDRPSLTLHSQFHGPIAFRLYRFASKQEWETATGSVLAARKPDRSWTKTYHSLRENNRQGEHDGLVAMEPLGEGYYLVTAEARYAPLLPACKFCVSHVAVYVRANRNQAVVVAVDRRTGSPVADLPLKLTVTGEPGIDRLLPPGETDSHKIFERGFRGQPAEEIRSTGPEAPSDPGTEDAFGGDSRSTASDNPTPAAARGDDLRKAAKEIPPQQQLREAETYLRGVEARRLFPDFKQQHTLRTGLDGSATVKLDLADPRYRYQLRVQRVADDLDAGPLSQTQVDYQEPQPDPERDKVTVWLAQPIYRPGSQVDFKGIVRKFNGVRIAPSRPNDSRQVTVCVENHDGKLWEGSCELSKAGTFQGRFHVPRRAAVGAYWLRIDGQVASPRHVLFVDEFRPPTFKVDIKTAQAGYVGGEPIEGTVTVEYLTGKPVAGADVELRLEANSFGRRDDRPIALGTSGCANNEGVFRFTTPAPRDSYSRNLKILATARDISGQSYTAMHAIVCQPGPFQVTVAPSPGKAIAGAMVDLKVRVSTWGDQPIADALVIADGVSECVKTDRSGKAVLRLTARREHGEHKINVKVVSAGKVVHADCSSLTLLEERSAKEGAVATVPVAIKPAIAQLRLPDRLDAGNPLPCSFEVEGERGRRQLVGMFVESNRLLYSKLLHLLPGEQRVIVPTEPDWAPGVHVTVVLLDGLTVSHKTQSCLLHPLEKSLKLELTTDKPEYRPGEPCRVEITATDHRGQPVQGAEISLGVVDESLYELMEDPTGNLFRFFHEYQLPHTARNEFDARLPDAQSLSFWLGPRYAWGYYDYPLGEIALGRHLSLIVRAGGRGASNRSPRPNPRARFTTAAHWAANLVADGSGKTHADFTFPDTLTTWRFTARGVTADTALGEIRIQRRTLLPLQVEVALPRALRVGDRIDLPVVIHNHETIDRMVGGTTRVGLLEQTWASRRLPAEGQQRFTIPVVAGSRQPIEVQATVRDDRHSDSDAVRKTLEPLPRSRPSVLTYSGAVGRSATIEVDPIAGEEDAEGAGMVTLLIRRESGLVGPVQSALDGLIEYPYGCVEQTMSRFMPAVVAGSAMKESGIVAPHAKRLSRVLTDGMARVEDFQHGDGGWGWWKEDKTNDFMTAYVLEGLARCRRLNQPVPDAMLDGGTRRLLAAFKDADLSGRRPESIGDVHLPVYAAHALALAHSCRQQKSQQADALTLRGLLQDIEDSRVAASLLDQILFADAWRLVGEKQRAEARLDQLAARVEPKRNDRQSIFATAALLELGAAVRPKDARWPPLSRQLVAARSGADWGDTLTTSAAVRGLAAVLVAPQSDEMPIVVRIDGRDVGELNRTNGNSMKLKLPQVKTVVLSAQGMCEDSYTIRVEGIANGAPPTAVAAPVAIRTRVIGTQPASKEIPADGAGRIIVPRGATCEVRVDIRLKQAVSHARLTIPRPCGVEWIRLPERVDGVAEVESRDDALHLFIEHWEAGEHSIRLLARAEVSGVISAPPPELVPMYGNSLPTAIEGATQWNVKD
ncbi:MAG: hypothetical protein K8T91_06085 [Planctomycetes bacterium]|nr:hypothetical protein [Planctomycetota bacterium]